MKVCDEMDDIIRWIINIIPVVGVSFWLASSCKMVAKAYKKHKRDSENYSMYKFALLAKNELKMDILYVGLCIINLALVNYRSKDPDYFMGSYLFNDTLSKMTHWIAVMIVTSAVAFMGTLAFLKFLKLEGIINGKLKKQN